MEKGRHPCSPLTHGSAYDDSGLACKLDAKPFAACLHPLQLTSLGALLELRLSCDLLAEDSLAPLASLASLRRLAWESDCRMPSSLAQLTQLEMLSVGGITDLNSVAVLEAALPALQRLTTLLLEYEMMPRQLPRSLASLPRLNRLGIGFVPPMDDPLALQVQLPAGPWVSSLRVLGVPFYVLCPSTEQLCSANQLEHLACFGPPTLVCTPDEEDKCASWHAFFGFLASHPPLRCFTIQSEKDQDDDDELFSREFVSTMCHLQRSRPGLLWRRASDGSFTKQVLRDSVMPTDPEDACL